MAPIVLVVPEDSYRTSAFLRAAATLRAKVVVAGSALHPLAEVGAQEAAVAVDLEDPDAAGEAIAAAVPDAAAVIAIDDEGVLTAAAAARVLGLHHNPPDAAAATRDKLLLRRLLDRAGVTQPRFAAAGKGEVADAAAAIGFPVVVKPTGLSAARGVIRATSTAEAANAELSIRRLLIAECGSGDEPLVVEEFIAGDELAIEGLLGPDGLEVLAVIDKPEPASGPYFAETFLTTPSRLPDDVQDSAIALVQDACAALGLVIGPVHAEVRIDAAGEPYLIEIAARSIGGLCSRALTFGFLGESLEVLILRAALGWDQTVAPPARPATGVLMLPIPSTGTFLTLEGVDRARRVAGIDEIELTVSEGTRVAALPEGDRYLGFVFASMDTPAAVEKSLRTAAAELTVVVDGEAVDPLAGQPWESSSTPA